MLRCGKGKTGCASIHSLSFPIFSPYFTKFNTVREEKSIKEKKILKSYHGTPVNNYKIISNDFLFALDERASFEHPELKSLGNTLNKRNATGKM